jgi:hypothetical protein
VAGAQLLDQLQPIIIHEPTDNMDTDADEEFNVFGNPSGMPFPCYIDPDEECDVFGNPAGVSFRIGGDFKVIVKGSVSVMDQHKWSQTASFIVDCEFV